MFVSISFLRFNSSGPKALLWILVHDNEAEPRSLNIPVPKWNLWLVNKLIVQKSMTLKTPLPFGLLTFNQLFLMSWGLPHPLDTVLEPLVAPQGLTSAAQHCSAPVWKAASQLWQKQLQCLRHIWCLITSLWIIYFMNYLWSLKALVCPSSQMQRLHSGVSTLNHQDPSSLCQQFLCA